MAGNGATVLVVVRTPWDLEKPSKGEVSRATKTLTHSRVAVAAPVPVQQLRQELVRSLITRIDLAFQNKDGVKIEDRPERNVTSTRELLTCDNDSQIERLAAAALDGLW